MNDNSETWVCEEEGPSSYRMPKEKLSRVLEGAMQEIEHCIGEIGRLRDDGMDVKAAHYAEVYGIIQKHLDSQGI